MNKTHTINKNVVMLLFCCY